MIDPVSRETIDRPDPGDLWPPVLELDAYAEILAHAGVDRGLIGPNEVPRLWQRHLLNCAAVALEPGLVGSDATVIDVGSGAGLPGLVWALVRPDLSITLLEPLLRRVNFLTETIAELGLGARVKVVRGRAESEPVGLRAQIVVARAVAPLARLAGWTLPLTEVGGKVLAIKGQDVAAEVAAGADQVRKFGGGPAQVSRIERPGLELPTTVLAIPRLK